jgi:hypothetical protein
MVDDNDHLENLRMMKEKALAARRMLAGTLASGKPFAEPSLIGELNRFTAMQDLLDAIDRAIEEEEVFDEDQDD